MTCKKSVPAFLSNTPQRSSKGLGEGAGRAFITLPATDLLEPHIYLQM
jgi:hypothetical protein